MKGPSAQSSTRWLSACQADVSIHGWDECLEQQRLYGSQQWSSALPCKPTTSSLTMYSDTISIGLYVKE